MLMKLYHSVSSQPLELPRHEAPGSTTTVRRTVRRLRHKTAVCTRRGSSLRRAITVVFAPEDSGPALVYLDDE